MTVYKYFLKNAFRRKSFLIVYFTMMMIFSVMNTSSSVKENQGSFQAYKPKVAVINESDSRLYGDLAAYLETVSVIKETPESMEAAREMVFMEKVDVVVRIPKDVEERLLRSENCVEILYDNKNIKGHIIENQLYKYLLLLKATESESGFDSELVDRLVKEEVEVVFRETETKHEDIYRKEWFSFYFRFSGYMITAVLIGIIGMTMSDFQKEEVSSRIQASSMKMFRLQMQMYLGQLSIAVTILLMVILFGIIMQKGQVFNGGNIGRHILNLSVFSLSILSMTFLINNIVKNKVVKSALSMVISLGMSFISGVMVPQEYLGELTLNLSKATPMYYFVRISDNINLESGELCRNIVIQLGFALLFLLLGILADHVKRRKGKG